MKTAAEIRKVVESVLASRVSAPFAAKPNAAQELFPSGIAELDAALGGGLPLGSLSELCGLVSSGRTTLALATVAGITQLGGTCAYVDVTDSFDPFSASALGVNLRHLLWVRVGEADAAVVGSPFPAVASAPPVQENPVGRGWCHPRTEALGMDHAIGEFFTGRHAATSTREPQNFTPRCSEPISRKRIEPVVFMPPPEVSRSSFARTQRTPSSQKPWSRLDKALRATDLLLNTGGFRAIVLDMGDVSQEHARRVPLATWYRFRLQVEKSQTLFLLLTRMACANSCAAVSLHCEEARANWRQADESSPHLLTGLSYRVNVARSRAADSYRKKPAASAQACWSCTTSFSR